LKRRILLLALALGIALPEAASPSPDNMRGQGRLAVLDLVDLNDNSQKVEISDALRGAVSANGAWAVLQKDSVSKRLGDFNINPRQGCNNPQCSFDIGNVVQAEYVIFGTSTTVASVEAVSLKLLHIPTAKIIWTKVLEGTGAADADRARSLEKAFASCAA